MTRQDRWPVPVHFDTAGRTVTLLDCPPLAWQEPFFHETIDRARREHREAREIWLDVAQFLDWSDRSRTEPAGFIYHAGRCGSTLLSNMLAASGDQLALKEPDPVSDLMAHRLATDDPDAALELERLIAAALRVLVRTGNPACCKLVKFAAWNIRCAASLSRDFPGTPLVFAYRVPDETVASLLFDPPSWSGLASCPRAMQARFFPTILDVAPDVLVALPVLFAHAWRSTAEAALALPPEAVLFVDYADLVRAPDRVLLRVSAHLRQPTGPGRIARMASAAGIYSKDPTGRTAFDPLGRHHRPPLSPLQRAVVADITGDAWSQLAQRRRAEAA